MGRILLKLVLVFLLISCTYSLSSNNKKNEVKKQNFSPFASVNGNKFGNKTTLRKEYFFLKKLFPSRYCCSRSFRRLGRRIGRFGIYGTSPIALSSIAPSVFASSAATGATAGPSGATGATGATGGSGAPGGSAPPAPQTNPRKRQPNASINITKKRSRRRRRRRRGRNGRRRGRGRRRRLRRRNRTNRSQLKRNRLILRRSNFANFYRRSVRINRRRRLGIKGKSNRNQTNLNNRNINNKQEKH